MKEKLKQLGGTTLGVIVFAGMVALVFRGCFGKTNEVGILGMDKGGRQILLQTLDHYAPEHLQFTSDWSDYSFIQRLWQEPMRTTFRVVTVLPEDEAVRLRIAAGLGQTEHWKQTQAFLDAPFEKFLEEYSEITVQEDLTVPIQEFKEHCQSKSVETVRDLLAGMGFKKYQMFVNEFELVSEDLPATNSTWLGH